MGSVLVSLGHEKAVDRYIGSTCGPCGNTLKSKSRAHHFLAFCYCRNRPGSAGRVQDFKSCGKNTQTSPSKKLVSRVCTEYKLPHIALTHTTHTHPHKHLLSRVGLTIKPRDMSNQNGYGVRFCSIYRHLFSFDFLKSRRLMFCCYTSWP